jgi:hypothetical protein
VVVRPAALTLHSQSPTMHQHEEGGVLACCYSLPARARARARLISSSSTLACCFGLSLFPGGLSEKVRYVCPHILLAARAFCAATGYV